MSFRHIGDITTFVKCKSKKEIRGTKVYRTHARIIQRCTNPTHVSYKNYGARGIKICDEWRHDFWKFFDYIGHPPDKSYDIDRINNDGNYEPGNVRWIPRSLNHLNRRKKKNSTSKHVGVSLCKSRLNQKKPWVAVMSLNNKTQSLGRFKTEHEAHLAYEAAKAERFKDGK